MKTAASIAFAALAALTAPSAKAAVLDFEKIGSSAAGFASVASPYTEGGFVLTTTGTNGFATVGSETSRSYYSGSSSIYVRDRYARITLTTEDPTQAFDLLSLDVAKLGPTYGGYLDMRGTRSSGTTVFETVYLPYDNSYVSTPRTVEFTRLTDVTSVMWFANTSVLRQFDNIVVEPVAAAVPLPAGMPLLMAGLAGLGLVRRRR